MPSRRQEPGVHDCGIRYDGYAPMGCPDPRVHRRPARDDVGLSGRVIEGGEGYTARPPAPLPAPGMERPWREIADLLAGELSAYAACGVHPVAAARAECRACAARAAMNVYRVARGR